MKKISFIPAVCFIWIVGLGFTQNAFGGAMDSSSIGVKSWMMGAAVTGIADDSSAVHFNPGGLVLNEDDKAWHAQAYGIFFLDATMKFTSRYGIKDESETDTILPGFFISKKYDNWAFGFGNYLPYASGGSTYKNFQGSQYDVKGGSGYMALTQAVSYKINPNLAIGAGFSAYYAFMAAEYLVQGSEFELNYKGISGYGLHVGIMYKLSRELGLGFCVRSPVDIEMEGETTIGSGGKLDSEMEFTLPYYFTFGLGYLLNPKTTIGFDICYMLYGDTDKKTVKIDGLAPMRGKTEYTDMWRISLGMDYQINQKSSFMAGIKYNEHSTKAPGLDTGTDVRAVPPSLIPSANDVDLYSFYSGVSYDYSEKTELNIGICYTMGIEREYQSQKYDQDHLYLLLGSRFRW